MFQMTLDQTENRELHIPLAGGGWIRYLPAFYTPQKADELFVTLKRNVTWNASGYARLTKWYDFEEHVDVIPPVLFDMREDAESFTFGGRRLRFHGVFLNQYRNGRDHVGFHRDEENPETAPIASISLGAARRFQIMYVGDEPLMQSQHGRYEFRLAHGSCLIMGGAIQRFWKHGVPREAGIQMPRINLTFRQYE